MANNRLFICDPEDKTWIMLAKGFGMGWELRCSESDLASFLEDREYGATYDGGPTALVLHTESTLPSDFTNFKATP